MVLGMEGFYTLLALQCVKLIAKLLYTHDHFEDQIINSCTYILTQEVNMLTTFSCAFACTDLQSMNAKYFKKPFINYSTINHTLRYKQVFII